MVHDTQYQHDQKKLKNKLFGYHNYCIVLNISITDLGLHLCTKLKANCEIHNVKFLEEYKFHQRLQQKALTNLWDHRETYVKV